MVKQRMEKCLIFDDISTAWVSREWHASTGFVSKGLSMDSRGLLREPSPPGFRETRFMKACEP